MVAEALANAGKYANADRVEIDVRQTGRQVELEITDDGRGGARVADGGTALDPEVVAQLFRSRREDAPLARLTPASARCSG